MNLVKLTPTEHALVVDISGDKICDKPTNTVLNLAVANPQDDLTSVGLPDQSVLGEKLTEHECCLT